MRQTLLARGNFGILENTPWPGHANSNAFQCRRAAGDTIYRLDRLVFGFEPGTAYSASDTAGIIGVLDLDNGVLTPIATGFGSTRGMTFVVLDKDNRENDDR